MRETLFQLIKHSLPRQIMLPRQHQWACRDNFLPVVFFAAILINFIMTGQLRNIYRDLQKTLQKRNWRQQTIPAGRYV